MSNHNLSTKAGQLQRNMVVEQFERHLPTRVYIVSSDNGINLLADLRSTTRMPLIAVPPGRDSKEARVEAVTGYWEAGRVLLPHHAAWKADFITEHLRFPAVAHDDQVDAGGVDQNVRRRIDQANHKRDASTPAWPPVQKKNPRRQIMTTGCYVEDTEFTPLGQDISSRGNLHNLAETARRPGCPDLGIVACAC